MRGLILAAGFVVALASPAVAGDVTPDRVIVTPGDTVTASLLGEWFSSPGSALPIAIRWLGPGTIQVRAPGFSALGFADGRTFIGMTRTSASGTARDSAPRFSVLRLVPSADGTIAAEFSDGLFTTPNRHETWTRTTAVGDGLPTFGDYVYVEELPEPIERLSPDYPDWARKKGVEGVVMIQALVGRDGLVKDVRVVKSIPDLDDYAKAAVKQWRFKPALSKGSPVAVWVAVPVKFSLH